jgi:hypothetical protein
MFYVQPLFLFVLVRQVGLRLETTLLATQEMSAATLSLTLSKPLFLYLCNLKVLKALGFWTGEGLCSLSQVFYSPLFAGITSSPPTEALS